MHAPSAAANLLWAGAAARAWWRFRSDLCRPLRLQHQILVEYLRENRTTAAGRTLGFGRILPRRRMPADERECLEVIDEYRARVPISSYDDLEPAVERIAGGEPGVLTAASPIRLVPSSGSTSAAKLIPGTRRLQQEFSRAVDAWIADLFRQQPELLAGPAYWSISPAVATPPRASAIPIGWDDDSAYLGAARRALARLILPVPDAVRQVSDPEDFRYVTLLFLLRARDLRLVSVWHPTFLERVLDALPAHRDALLRDVAEGTLTLPGTTSARIRTTLRRRLRPDPRRAAELQRLAAFEATSIWPRLSLVSCWADGAAERHARTLAARLGTVALQPKGLLATEGVVTIPFGGRHPVAIRSHFFEFLDAAGRPRLAHELATGEEYGVVLTTGGGLYRYRLGDRVRVDGWVSATPSLRFVGRDDRVSDRRGEKISDGFVSTVLDRLFEDAAVPGFAMLAPEETPDGLAYTLFLDLPQGGRPLDPVRLERELRRNPHYAWCVDLGQLRPARVVAVAPGADRAYVDACVARGQRLGEVKPVCLHTDTGWEGVLKAVTTDASARPERL